MIGPFTAIPSIVPAALHSALNQGPLSTVHCVRQQAQCILHQYTEARTTDTQREVFFETPKLLGLGRQIGPKIIGAVGVFSAKLSAPILVLWVTCPCFPLFLQKIKPL